MQVACGARHTAFLTACGSTFTCGWGKWGQLGVGDSSSRHEPVSIALPVAGQVTDIACGWWHALIAVQN